MILLRDFLFFLIETEMTIHAVDKNYKIKEIPVTYRDRPQGSVSKLNTYSDGIKVLKTIATLFKEYKPMGFFSLISLLLVLISLIFLIPPFTGYFKTGLVDKLPSLIVGAFIILTAILSLMCGIILQVIVKKDRQQYELLMNEMKMIVQKGSKEDV